MKFEWNGVSYKAEANGFVISFNPVATLPDGETALVIPDTSKLFRNRFLILNGDWRDAYAELGTKEACIALFAAKREAFGNFWSDELPSDHALCDTLQ